MLEMIETLIEKGHAYRGAEWYGIFRSRSFKGYGKLSQKIWTICRAETDLFLFRERIRRRIR